MAEKAFPDGKAYLQDGDFGTRCTLGIQLTASQQEKLGLDGLGFTLEYRKLMGDYWATLEVVPDVLVNFLAEYMGKL